MLKGEVQAHTNWGLSACSGSRKRDRRCWCNKNGSRCRYIGVHNIFLQAYKRFYRL